MSQNRSSNHTLPLSRNRYNIGSKDDSLRLVPHFTYLNLAISSACRIYGAYINNDKPMIAVMLFGYFAYFWLDYCFRVLNKLPQSDNSIKKKFLKLNIWAVSTAVMFGFACEFGTYVFLAATLAVFGVAIASSSCLFYFYFIADDQTSSRLSRPSGKASISCRRVSNAYFFGPQPSAPVPPPSAPSLSITRLFSSSSSSQTPNCTFAEQVEDEVNQSTSPPTATISIDRSGLYNAPEHSHEPSPDSELVKQLKSIIKFRGGPISVAEYMEEVLTNPKAGFYINRDVFGAEGDFITSPEVSQMFGEMVGVWALCLWEQMGQPNKVNLVELGPGRGTLMADLLRGASKFNNFTKSLHIHMVECSPTLQKLQHSNLKCNDEDNTVDKVNKRSVSMLAGTPVTWHAALEQVPSGVPTILIAHEFFDALPVHQFQLSIKLMKALQEWAATEELAKLDQIEVCPQAMELTQSIANRISSNGGGALIIDYGLNAVISDSLQAIRKHKFVDILDDPGSADLSAYVDFASIRHSAEEISGDVSIHGPITQSQFLGSLGINFRVEALLQNCTEEQAESLRTGYWRLVGEGEAPFWEGPEEHVPIGMGTRYLAMAIVNKRQGVPVPFQ
ncbi:NADH dehydrogenase [ubiquinone] complex I, assembly factor 7 [Morella rubra]|uniref:type II protein arginine methyltransferase n=1 Tax=Morella rubra TaxID=262757 RepID=A0A6A1WRE0_9ROSI|nr:NADH dehydrogenase [ubiquinone] complex I, assembly factor 7 [Morella rubra]